MGYAALALFAVVVVFAIEAIRFLLSRLRGPPVIERPRVGGVTLDGLPAYAGYDMYKPLLIAVKGYLYDVSEAYETYGPGKNLHVYAGRECSRALAKGSTDVEDCIDNLDGLTAQEIEKLDNEILKLKSKFKIVGEIVPPVLLTTEQLAQHDGTDPEKHMYLAIKGVIYDIRNGKAFYGPNGIYPFAGRECARAFALVSTSEADCNDNLEGLGKMELDTLADWQAKFNSKYPIVGKIVQD